MATLVDRFAQEIARSTSLPARPEVLNRLIGALRSADAVSLPEFAGIIRQDPALSGGLLKMANAAVYGGHGEIFSIPEALLRIGLAQTGRLALALSLYNMLPRSSRRAANARDFWLHSLGTATAASVIVCRMPKLASIVSEEEAFLLGLFHDVGLLALAGYYDDEYRAARRVAQESERPYYAVEAEVLGTDHGTLGALIAHSWGLPALAVEAIRVHHAPGDIAPELRCRVEVVQLAETVCLQAGLGDLAEGDRTGAGVVIVGGEEINPEVIDAIVCEAREETKRSDALLVLA
jgi:HD-like signal output (HDOD) protein